MEHISSCMRPAVDVFPVYIIQEPSSPSVSTLRPSLCSHEPLLVSSNIFAKKDIQQSPSFAIQAQVPASKYQLWSAKSDKLAALSVDPSSSTTSLSDGAILPERVPFRQRNASMSRRRNLSIAGVGAAMTTVHEMAIDSPTIPGRPPLRKLSDDSFNYDRAYSSSETNWRAGPFGNALVSSVTGPSPSIAQQIMSPTSEMLSPYSRPSTRSPTRRPSVQPLPEMHTTSIHNDHGLPPEVPPKLPAIERKGSPPLKLDLQITRTQLLLSASAASGRRSPPSSSDTKQLTKSSTPLPTPPSETSPPFHVPSMSLDRHPTRSEKRNPISPHIVTAHTRIMSESSIGTRGRPTDRKGNNLRKHNRAFSEGDSRDSSTAGAWELPQGMRIPEASARMCDDDKKLLHKQACDQASKFEVLNKHDVTSLSRELRALDERCDYLRKTYKSLRAGRQKLHSRMIAYLRRDETVIFSRDSLLKQEEALNELDISIDEFISKLEQAENRRLRIRQKLLEHVAAAIVLDSTAPRDTRGNYAETTPPRSPVEAKTSRTRAERNDTESIKIYADSHILNLFTDIEKAIGVMCEQTC